MTTLLGLFQFCAFEDTNRRQVGQRHTLSVLNQSGFEAWGSQHTVILRARENHMFSIGLLRWVPDGKCIRFEVKVIYLC